jgi:hypothetical protein
MHFHLILPSGVVLPIVSPIADSPDKKGIVKYAAAQHMTRNNLRSRFGNCNR